MPVLFMFPAFLHALWGRGRKKAGYFKKRFMKNMPKLLSLFLCSCLLFQTAVASIEKNPLPEEAAHHILQKAAGIRRPAISLNGTWQFQYSPSHPLTAIQIPGEAAMQGYAIEHDKPYIYRKTFTLPADYDGNHIILRFDGVYSHARLSINGQFVREHHGGFTRWETDITPYVRPGQTNELQLEVTDRLDDISYASGYAHHPIGGILRNVTVFALPPACLYDFHFSTDFDGSFRDAVLRIGYRAQATGGTFVEYTLTAPDGRKVELAQNRFSLQENENTNELPVSSPLKWDAEHPNLYTLTVTLCNEDGVISQTSHRVGFRKIKIDGDRMLVNGKPVKLRGACRHDIHPRLGRTTTPELDSLDATLFKQANMNFVRTSHYPPSEKFLEYCDRLGIYVECETAVCFVDTYRQKNYGPGKSQNDPVFTPRYLSQCREMVKSFRSHPSILFWSIGNESVYGINFQQSWDWVKHTDPTRPVIFSYPGSVGDREKIYDILSMHYQDVNGNIDQWNRSTRNFQGHGIPALFDEWAHPACYTYTTLQNDPNIREFWGISIDKMWAGLFDAPGGLGGAIWGYIDETFMLPEPQAGTAFWKEFARTAKPENYQGNCVGYGEWGIVDVWRRQKPEFWATKKAYSPVKLLTTQIDLFTTGHPLSLPVYNRFDHTNLDEIKIVYNYKGKEKQILSPSVAPHQKGEIILPPHNWQAGENILIQFFSSTGALIDAEQIILGKTARSFSVSENKSPLRIEETSDKIIVKGDGFEIPFCKSSGLIQNATSKGKIIIKEGPFVHLDINLNHLTGAEVRKSASKYQTSETDWQLKGFSYTNESEQVIFTLSGVYKTTAAEIKIAISPDGRMKLSYHTSGEPNGYLRETGLSFRLTENFNRIQWERKGYWSYYPSGAFAGNSGTEPLYHKKQAVYGEAPTRPWKSDTHNYYYWADSGTDCLRPLTQAAKGMKENIYNYSLLSGKRKALLTVVSPDASLACRLHKQANGQFMLYVNDRWDYPEIAWGNYCKTLPATPCRGEMEIIF